MNKSFIYLFVCELSKTFISNFFKFTIRSFTNLITIHHYAGINQICPTFSIHGNIFCRTCIVFRSCSAQCQNIYRELFIILYTVFLLRFALECTFIVVCIPYIHNLNLSFTKKCQNTEEVENWIPDFIFFKEKSFHRHKT